MDKILVIHNDYQQPGGETVAVKAEMSLLQKYGHPVIPYFRDNLEIERYGQAQKAVFLVNTVFSMKTYQEIRALVRREQPNVAHVHNVFPLVSPAVYRALKREGIPIVQTVHNFRFLCPNALFYTQGHICERCKYGNTLHAIRWRCYRQSYLLSALYALTIGLHRRWGTFDQIDCFAPVSEFVGCKLLESGLTSTERVAILENFLPDPLPEPGSFERRESYLVYIGRISPEKGVQVLLEALVDLPGISLRIAGGGPQAETLKAQAIRQGLQVEFLGYVTGEEKWALLRQAMAVVVPSVWYEAFPFATLESMASGTPVVASNLGSLPYVVEDGRSGLLFRAGNSQHLRERILWLMRNPFEALQMGHYGRRMVEIKYNAAAHYQKLMEVYTKIM